MGKLRKNYYALYGGKDSDTYLCGGSIEDIAEYLGVSVKQVYFYMSPAWKRRKHRLEVIKIKGEYI